jgi:small ligand-binding sensory domain FIST
VGVAFGGALEVDVIVSQGCRPIGRPLKVTAAYENYLLKLEDKVPLDYLKEMVNELPADDRELLQNGLFIGRAIDKEQTELGRGDFLVRAVTGIDQKDGSLVVGDYIRSGEIVQFHLRDADTAEEDLEMMLMPQLFNSPAAGALLFSCNGRGTRLYAHPNGDIRLIKSVLNNIAVGGFFCAGEIGPIGGENFLHGHTATLTLFRSTLTGDESAESSA